MQATLSSARHPGPTTPGSESVDFEMPRSCSTTVVLEPQAYLSSGTMPGKTGKTGKRVGCDDDRTKLLWVQRRFCMYKGRPGMGLEINGKLLQKRRPVASIL